MSWLYWGVGEWGANTKIFNIKVLKGNHSSCQRKETCGKPNILSEYHHKV